MPDLQPAVDVAELAGEAVGVDLKAVGERLFGDVMPSMGPKIDIKPVLDTLLNGLPDAGSSGATSVALRELPADTRSFLSQLGVRRVDVEAAGRGAQSYTFHLGEPVSHNVSVAELNFGRDIRFNVARTPTAINVSNVDGVKVGLRGMPGGLSFKSATYTAANEGTHVSGVLSADVKVLGKHIGKEFTINQTVKPF